MSGSRHPRWSGKIAILSTAIPFGASGCHPHYHAPDLSPDKLATVSPDSRAKVLSVDGLSLPPDQAKGSYQSEGDQQQKEFRVGPGCRTLIAKYKESFYETLKPIRFFVPVRAGYRYWVTATFTGREFLPRVVEIEPSGEASAEFLPDVPCEATKPEATKPEPSSNTN